MEHPAEELRTDGVVLRRWRATDADLVHAIVTASMEHLRPWMPWAADGYTWDDSREFVESSDRDWDAGVAFNFMIVTTDGEVAGSCGLMTRCGHGALEIGYWLRPDATGRGLATMATAVLTAEAFRIGAAHVEIVHDAANTRSGAVPARLGFTEVERRPQTPPATGTDVRWIRTAPR